MIDGRAVLALVPARSGSKGLPGKNVRPLAGKPLLAWPIAAARGSAYVDRVVVSTDSEEYAATARRHGAEVPFLRPPELASDTAPSIGFILHALDAVAGDGRSYEYLVLLEPTSPLTEPADVDAALRALHADREHSDAVVSVAELVSTHPAFAVRMSQGALLSPYASARFGDLPRRQDVEPLYSLDGSLYISSVAALRRERSFCHARTRGHVMPRHKSLEVDDLVDFVCIEAILANRGLLEAAATHDATRSA